MVKNKNRFANIYLAFMLIFLYAPIALLIIYSFNSSRIGNVWTGFSVKWYRELLKDRAIMTSLRNTIIVALTSSASSALLGTIGAIGIFSFKNRSKKFMQNLAYITMINPDIVIGVSLLSMFSLIHGLKLGFATLILAHITFCLPYVIFSVMPRLASLDPNLAEAAYDLGASPMQAFMKVILPEIMPGILSGFFMSITISIDDFIVSFFTTGPGVSTLSITVYSMTKRGISPKVNALTAVMFAFILAAMVINYLRKPSKNVLQM